MIQALEAGWQGLLAAAEVSVAALEPPVAPWSDCLLERHAHLQLVWVWPLHPQIQQEPNKINSKKLVGAWRQS